MVNSGILVTTYAFMSYPCLMITDDKRKMNLIKTSPC